jgi:hypothetical protein
MHVIKFFRLPDFLYMFVIFINSLREIVIINGY